MTEDRREGREKAAKEEAGQSNHRRDDDRKGEVGSGGLRSDFLPDVMHWYRSDEASINQVLSMRFSIERVTTC